MCPKHEVELWLTSEFMGTLFQDKSCSLWTVDSLRLFRMRPCWLHWSEAQQSDSLSEQYEQRVQDIGDTWGVLVRYSDRVSVVGDFICPYIPADCCIYIELHFHVSTSVFTQLCTVCIYMCIYCFNSVPRYVLVIQSFIYIYTHIYIHMYAYIYIRIYKHIHIYI